MRARAEGGPALADLDLGPVISKRQHEIVRATSAGAMPA